MKKPFSPALTLSILLALLFIPVLSLAQDKAAEAEKAAEPADPKKMGEGDYRYDWQSGWGTIGEDLKATHGGVAVDADGLIYCSMDSERSILVYNADGEVVRNFDPKYRGMHGIWMNTEGDEQFLYGTGRDRAVKFKLDGTVVWEMKGAPKSDDFEVKRYNVTGITVAPNGDFYLADGYGSNWIYQFDKDQKFIKRFGGPGNGDGQFRTCHGIGLDTRGEEPLLLICDRANNRLQHFTLDGEFVSIVTTGLRRPCSLSFHGDHVAIAELQARVTIIDGENKHAQYLGDNPNKGHWSNFRVDTKDWVEGYFTAPHGVSYDADGNLIVMDWNFKGRINKLVKAAE